MACFRNPSLDNYNQKFSTSIEELYGNCRGCEKTMEVIDQRHSDRQVTFGHTDNELDTLKCEVGKLMVQQKIDEFQINRLQSGLNNIKNKIAHEEARRENEIALGDVIGSIYSDIWIFIKQNKTLPEWISRSGFFDDLPGRNDYQTMLNAAVTGVGLTMDDYDLLVTMKDIRNSSFHMSNAKAVSFLQKSKYNDPNHVTARKILLKLGKI